MPLVNPNYTPINFDTYNLDISVNPNFSAEKDNYSTDITTSTNFTKLVTSLQMDHSYNLFNDERQIQINNYYILKYQAESNVLKQIIFFCGLAIIGCLFFMNGLISESVYVLYLGIIIGIGCIYVSYSIYKLMFRDKIRYNEYDFGDMYDPGKGTDLSYNTGVHNKVTPVKLLNDECTNNS